MDNHYHLVVETPQANLALGMRQLNGLYTQAYNRRHSRVGHLFQGRYQTLGVRSCNNTSDMPGNMLDCKT
jgi:REP-associated tyrosine transposase